MKWTSSTYSRDTAASKIENVLERIGAFRALSDKEARGPAPANFLDGEPSAKNLAAFHNEGLRDAIGSVRRYLSENIKAICHDKAEERLIAQSIDALGFMVAILHPAQFGPVWRPGRIPCLEDAITPSTLHDPQPTSDDRERDQGLGQLAGDAVGGLSTYESEFLQRMREDWVGHAQQWNSAEKCLVELQSILRCPPKPSPIDENSKTLKSIHEDRSSESSEPTISAAGEATPEIFGENGSDRATGQLDPRDSGQFRTGKWFENATGELLSANTLCQRKRKGKLPSTFKKNERLYYCIQEVSNLYPEHGDRIRRAVKLEGRDS